MMIVYDGWLFFPLLSVISLFQEFSSSEFHYCGGALPCWKLAVENVSHVSRSFVSAYVCWFVRLGRWLARLDVIYDEYDFVWRYLQGCYVSFYINILIFMIDEPSLVINAILTLNMLFISYGCLVRPHDNSFQYTLELANESILHIICAHLALSLLSTGITFDETLGWSLCAWIAALLVVNLLTISIMTLVALKSKCMLYF